jgi:hypothetical protein
MSGETASRQFSYAYEVTDPYANRLKLFSHIHSDYYLWDKDIRGPAQGKNID